MTDSPADDQSSAVTVVHLSGEYDIYRREELDQHLRQAGNSEVAVLDFRDVPYIDSTAITCLIRLRRRMSERGAAIIRIAGPQANVRRVLELTRLDKLFEVYASLDEALSRV